MSSFKIHLRDGTVQEFNHVGRAGGSYTKTIKYEPGFAVIHDEYGAKYSIPSDLIQLIEEYPERY